MSRWRILFLVLFIVSCYKSTDKPDELLSKDEMTSVLTDLYLYKQVSAVNHQGSPPNHEDITAYVLQKHKISPLQFKESYSYYLLDNHTIHKIMDQVKENLQDKLKEIPKEETLETQEEDTEEVTEENSEEPTEE